MTDMIFLTSAIVFYSVYLTMMYC